MAGTSSPVCPWCRVGLPVRDPDRFGALDRAPDPAAFYRGEWSPFPVRVCGPGCEQRPEGMTVNYMRRFGR